jgi:hypothetical protein
VALENDVVAKVENELSHLQLSRTFFYSYSKNFESLQQTYLNEKDGHCDMICKLNSGERILVEANLLSEDALDPRMLAFALNENQLRKDQKWGKLEAVYAVNIMACEFSTRFRGSPPGEYRRHYKMTDLSIKDKPRSLERFNLIQISLHDVDLEKVADVEERWWLDFFKNGENYDAVPNGCPPLLKRAYEKIRYDALPPAIRSALDTEDGRYKNLKERSKQEAKKELLRTMLLNGEISQETYESWLRKITTFVKSP